MKSVNRYPIFKLKCGWFNKNCNHKIKYQFNKLETKRGAVKVKCYKCKSIYRLNWNEENQVKRYRKI